MQSPIWTLKRTPKYNSNKKNTKHSRQSLRRNPGGFFRANSRFDLFSGGFFFFFFLGPFSLRKKEEQIHPKIHKQIHPKIHSKIQIGIWEFRGQNLGKGNWTQIFLLKLFGRPWDIPAKSRDILPKKFDFPGFEGRIELFGPHPFTWKTPTPLENIRTKKFGFGFLFPPWKSTLQGSVRENTHTQNWGARFSYSFCYVFFRRAERGPA